MTVPHVPVAGSTFVIPALSGGHAVSAIEDGRTDARVVPQLSSGYVTRWNRDRGAADQGCPHRPVALLRGAAAIIERCACFYPDRKMLARAFVALRFAGVAPFGVLT
jgi:hypothetical protein